MVYHTKNTMVLWGGTFYHGVLWYIWYGKYHGTLHVV